MPQFYDLIYSTVHERKKILSPKLLVGVTDKVTKSGYERNNRLYKAEYNLKRMIVFSKKTNEP